MNNKLNKIKLTNNSVTSLHSFLAQTLLSEASALPSWYVYTICMLKQWTTLAENISMYPFAYMFKNIYTSTLEEKYVLVFS